MADTPFKARTGLDVEGNIAVTGTVDGRDVATDGTKLDGIAINANKYVLPTASASTLGGIKVGSGLSISSGVLSATGGGSYTQWHVSGDADSQDITDGKWVKFEGASSITGAGTEANPYVVNITPGSAGLATNANNVDVNDITTGTGYRLVFADSSGTSYEQMNVHNGGIEYDPGTKTLRVGGDIVAYNNFSDKTLKKNIKEYQGGLGAILKLNPVTYEWKKGREGVEIGLIAQEVEEVVPQVVREQQRMDEGIYKTVDYEKLVAVLIDAVQDQQKQIDELKGKLDGFTK